MKNAQWTLLALLIVFAVGSLLCLSFGESPLRIYQTMLLRTWGEGYGLGQVLYKASGLFGCALSVALAFRAGLFNVGAEGQLLIGAFSAAMVGAALPNDMSALLALPLCLLASLVGGALCGAMAGLLKAWRGVHEVIGTIMLNFIALSLLNYLLVEAHFALPESVHTAPVVAGARLSLLGSTVSWFAGSAVNTFLFMSIVLGCWYVWFLQRSKTGFWLRVLGGSPEVAETFGRPPARLMILAMAVAGALSGLCGANFVLGYKGYFEENFSSGLGFSAIAVAFLGNMNPLGMAAAALFLATLSQGAIAVNEKLPKDSLDILQGILILAVVAVAKQRSRTEASS